MLKRVKAREKGVTGYINCLRGSWLGNPFPLNRYSREKCLELYREYLDWRYHHDAVFREYLNELHMKASFETILLGCTCKLTEKCHVDELISYIIHSVRLDKLNRIRQVK